MNEEKYYLIGRTTDVQKKLYICKEEWESLKYANSIISHILSAERRYEIMILNYKEFEETLLSMGVKENIGTNTFDNSDEILTIICKSVINMLLSIIIYVEKYDARIKKNNKKNRDELESLGLDHLIILFDNEIKITNDYEFIKQLRNHSSHYDLPLHSVEIDNEIFNENQKSKRNIGTAVIPLLDIEILLQDKFFHKKEILFKISDSKGKIDLRIPIRKVVSRISSFHIKSRGITEYALEKSKEIIEETFQKYNSYYSTEIKYGKAVHESEKSKDEEIYFSLNDFDRIQKSHERNGKVLLLEKTFIHNKIQT